MGAPFTFDTPDPLPVVKRGGHWWTVIDGRSVRLSNLDKVFWPDERYTKGDLLAYYYNVAPVMLRYLIGRPLTMKRMPDGARGPHFYEKNAPSHTPEWIERCRVASEDGITNYLMVSDTAGMLFVANLGCIEFHPLHSRCRFIEAPDYMFFDLDPFEPATFDDVRAVALHVQAVLDTLGLPSTPKTSGATGMQIYVGLKAGPTYDAVRQLVGALGRLILKADPDRVTMEWEISKRTGKVFIDHGMNRQGANIAGVYSVRPEPGATVSMPLTWQEVADGVHPSDFTIVNAHDRIAKVGDLFAPVYDDRVDLDEVFDRLGIAPPAHAAADPQAGDDASRQTQETQTKEGQTREGQTRTAPVSLGEYRRKRDFGATPEPPPAFNEPSHGPPRFVIQKHNATRLHYDFRLERDGVLVSWAVPKGLPTTTGDRRLAVPTEDHPLEYGDFEGDIPEGNYGAGEVRIFDRGTYEALEWTDRKITLRLEGARVRGEYHMVRTAQGWLILLSKRSVDEQPAEPPPLRPMLAEGGHKAFDDPSWRFEPKMDGVRTLAYVAPDETRLVSRTGRDHTGHYPELGRLAESVNAQSAVLDGEIVALDEAGRPSFERLQQRINLGSVSEIERMRRSIPVTLYVFDILWLDGRDVTREPLEERRTLLEEIVTESGPMRLTFFMDGDGLRLMEAARSLGIEGVVAKRLGSIYQPGRRTTDWRKIKIFNRQDCVILGWTPGTGSRGGSFGALLVGAYLPEGGGLRWIGQVGTGFTGSKLREMTAMLHDLEIPEPPIEDSALRKVKGARWVRPELVCEVEFLEMTHSGRKLRAPSFKGLRDDKLPEDCVLEPPRM